MSMFGEIAVESFKKRVIERVERLRDAHGREAEAASTETVRIEFAHRVKGLAEALEILRSERVD